MAQRERGGIGAWAVFALVIAGILALAAGAANLRVSAETRVLAAMDDPVRLRLERFEQRFAQNNNLLFVVTPSGDGQGALGPVFTGNTLAAVDAVSEGAKRLPYFLRVDSITEFPLLVSEEDAFGVSPLKSREGLLSTEDSERLRAVQREVLAEPWLEGLLINREASVTGVNALFVLPADATQEIAEIIPAAEALVARVEADYPGVEIRLTGNVALMNAFADSAKSDIIMLIPLSFLVVGFVAFLFLRDLTLLVVLAAYLGLASAGAMGAAGWAGHVINPATAVAPVIVMTLALASAIHLLSGIQLARARGLDSAAAVDASLAESRNAILLTIITTMLGFVALNFSAAPPLRALGNIVAAGLALSAVLVVFAVPMVLRRLPIRAREAPASKVLGRIIDAMARRRFSVLALTIFLGAGAASGIAAIKLDDDFIRYFDTRFDYRQASDYAEDRLTGLNLLEFAVEAGEEQGINDPAYVQRLDAFTKWLRGQDGVEHVVSMSDKLRQLHGFLAPDAPEGALPDDQDLIAQYLLLFEFSLPAGADIADRIDASRSATRVSVAMRHVTSADIRALNARAAAWLEKNNPVPEQDAGTSINYFFATLSLTNIRSMIGGTAIALTAISIVILIALADVRLGVASLIANLLPPIVGFGIWGFTVGEIGLASSVVAAMTFGIVVDDSIHFLLRYKQERRAGRRVAEAVRLAYTSVGRAMVITSAALAAGFLLLIVSGFEINSSLGLFTSLIVVSALVLDLTLLPLLLLVFDRDKARPDVKAGTG